MPRRFSRRPLSLRRPPADIPSRRQPASLSISGSRAPPFPYRPLPAFRSSRCKPIARSSAPRPLSWASQCLRLAVFCALANQPRDAIPGMIERDKFALRAHLKRIIAASFLTLALVASAAAFAIGFTGSLNKTLTDPRSPLRLRTTALDALDESLGYSGFLRVYRSFLSTRDGTEAVELRVLVNQADADLASLSRASTNETDAARVVLLGRLAAPFRRTALFAAAPAETTRGLAPLAELEGDYSTLRSQIEADTAAANSARLNDLAQALVWAQATSIGALSLLSTVLLALAWFLRERLIGP